MTQGVTCLLPKHEDPRLDPRIHVKGNWVVQACHPSIGDQRQADSRDLLASQCHKVAQRESLSQLIIIEI